MIPQRKRSRKTVSNVRVNGGLFDKIDEQQEIIMSNLDTFTRAFYAAMDFESGDTFRYWEPAVQQGLIDTKQHRIWCGYTDDDDDPDDHGKETKFGISKAANPEVNVTLLTLDQAKEVYKRKYWNVNHCDKMRDYVAAYTYDCAAGSGPFNAAKFLQRAVGVADDGVVGPKTIEAANSKDWRSVVDAMRVQRLNHYAEKIAKDPSQKRFIGGWTRRANEFIKVFDSK